MSEQPPLVQRSPPAGPAEFGPDISTQEAVFDGHVGQAGLTRWLRGLAADGLTRTSSGLMALTVLNSAIGYVFWTIAARLYPAAEVGIASVIASTSILVALLSDLGVRTVVMQELPVWRESREWSRRVTGCLLVCSAASVLLATGVGVVLALSSLSLAGFLRSPWLVVFVVMTLATAQVNLLDGIATAERKAVDLILRNAVTAVAKIVLLAVFGWAVGWSWRTIVLATAGGFTLGALYGVAVQLRRFHAGWRFTAAGSGTAMRGLGRGLALHHLLNLGGQLPMYVLPLEVVARLNSRDNAYLSLTWMVGAAFMMVSPAVSAALFVEGRWNPDGIRSTTRRAVRIIALLLAPIGAFMLIFGHWVLGIFGHGYASAGYGLLCILALSSIPDAYTNIWIARYRAEARLVEATVLNSGIAVIAIVGTWLTLPSLGINGAGWSWTVAQAAGCVWAKGSDAWLRRRRTAAPAASDRALAR